MPPCNDAGKLLAAICSTCFKSTTIWGNHLSKTTCLTQETWRILLQLMAVLDTTKHT